MFVHSFATPLCLLLLLALQGCGFRPVEGDKHPEIPVFPEHTNENVEITRLIDEELGEVQMAAGRYYAIGNRSVSVFDSTFDLRSLIRLEGKVACIDEQGAMYFRVEEEIHSYESLDVGLMKAAPPDLAPVALPAVILGYSVDADSRLTRSEDGSWVPNDSLEQVRLVDRTINDQVRCVQHTSNGELMLVSYADSQCAITSSSLVDDRIAKLGIPQCPSGIQHHELGEALEPFDTAVMDYKGYGNHFAGGFNQTVNQYYSIEVAGEEMQFKSFEDEVRILKRTADAAYVFANEGIYRIARTQ